MKMAKQHQTSKKNTGNSPTAIPREPMEDDTILKILETPVETWQVDDVIKWACSIRLRVLIPYIRVCERSEYTYAVDRFKEELQALRTHSTEMLKHWEATKRRSMLRSTDNLQEESSDYESVKPSQRSTSNGIPEYCARGGAKEVILRKKPVRNRPKSSTDLNDLLKPHQRSLKSLTNDEVFEWIKKIPSDSLDGVAKQIKDLGVTGKQLANPDFVTNLLQQIDFTDSQRRQSFLLKLLQRIRDEEQAPKSKPRNNRSKSVKTRRKHVSRDEPKRKLSGAFVPNENVTYSMTLKENVPNFAHVRTLSTGNRSEDGGKEKSCNGKLKQLPPSKLTIDTKNYDNRLCRSTESLMTSSDYVSGGSSTTSATASDTPQIIVSDGDRVKKNLEDQNNRLRISSSSSAMRKSPNPSFTSSSSNSSFPLSNGSCENISTTNKMKKKFAQLRDRMGNMRLSKQHELTVRNVPTAQTKQHSSKIHNIVLYSDLASPGTHTSFELPITTTTTAQELVQMFLDFCSIIDDVNLYALHQVTRSIEGSKVGTILSKEPISSDTCPYNLYEALERNPVSVSRFELVKACGVTIKIFCKLGSHKPRANRIQISNNSTVGQVLRISLRKFRLRNVDSCLFSFCELGEMGEIRELNEESPPSWKSENSYLLTDRSNTRPTMTDHWKNEFLSVKCGLERSLSNSSKQSDLSSLSDISQNSSAYESDNHNSVVTNVIPYSSRGSRTSHNPSTSSMFGEIGVTYDVRMSDEEDSDVFYNDCETMKNTIKPNHHSHLCPKHIVKSASTSTMLHSNDALRVDNAALRAQLQEREEKLVEIHKKTEKLRKILESGLQGQLQFQQAITNGHDNNNHALNITNIESEMRSLEQQINNTETILSQLFRHQRKVLLQSKNANDDRKYLPGIDILLSEEEASNIDSINETEFKIATHQSNLLTLKHKYHILDMQLSLLVTQRKGEKFRQLCQSSLYDILSEDDAFRKQFINNNEIKLNKHRCNGDPRHYVHHCEIYAGSSGYGLSLMQDKGKNVDSGILVDTPHIQGRLKRGDRLLEINGVNVQSSSTEFVAKLLKGTKCARIVILRKIHDLKATPNGCNGNTMTPPETPINGIDYFDDAVDLV